MVAGGPQRDQIRAAAQPALGHGDDRLRHLGNQRMRRIQVYRQRAQIPVVHADDAGFRRQGSRQLGPIVYLHQHRQTILRRRAQQPAQLIVGQGGHDQQRCVGAGRARLDQLIARHDEVLAQERQRDLLAHRGKVAQRAVEERRLGQDGDGGRPCRLVFTGDPLRMIVGAEHAFRRRPALALGDDVESSRRGQTCAKRRCPGRPSCGDALQRVQADALLAAGHLVARRRHDRFEQVRRSDPSLRLAHGCGRRQFHSSIPPPAKRRRAPPACGPPIRRPAPRAPPALPRAATTPCLPRAGLRRH